jgi:hypothetical protein
MNGKNSYHAINSLKFVNLSFFHAKFHEKIDFIGWSIYLQLILMANFDDESG